MAPSRAASGDAARDALWVTVSLLAARGLGFATSIVAARLLTVPDMAAYLVAVSVAVVLVPVADLGHWQLVARGAAREGRTSFRFGWLRSSARSRAPYWLVLGGAIVVVGSSWGVAGPIVIGGLVVSAVGQVLVDAAAAELFGRREFRYGAAVRVLPALVGFVLTASLAALGATFENAVIAFGLSRFVPGVLLLLLSRGGAKTPGLGLTSGMAFAGSTVLMIAYTRSDLILLQWFDTSSILVAQYGIAYSVLIALQVLPSALATALFPRLAGSQSNDRQRARSALLVACVGIGIGGPVAVAAWIGAPVLMALFGSDYSQGLDDVSPLFLTLAALTLGQVGVSSLQAMGFERRVLGMVACVAVLNIAGNALLIPVIGVTGAVLATLTAESAMAMLALLKLAKVAQVGQKAVLGIAALPASYAVDQSGTSSAILLVAVTGLVWGANPLGARTTLTVAARSALSRDHG